MSTQRRTKAQVMPHLVIDCNSLPYKCYILQKLVCGFNKTIEKTLNDQVIPDAINELCFKFYFLGLSHKMCAVLIPNIFAFFITEIEADSYIIKEEEYHIFDKLLEENKISIGFKWKLLFRATQDGIKWDIFNEKCCGIPNVICVISSKEGNVFGGFTKVGWPKLNNHGTRYNRDENAFLYILRNVKYESEIFNVRNDSNDEYALDNAVQNCWGCLCCFGDSGIDICILDKDQSGHSWVDERGRCGRCFDTKTAFRLNGGNHDVNVLEIEVFECCDK